MNVSFFQKRITAAMCPLKEKYSLTEEREERTIKYRHENFVLEFTLDHHLEVSVSVAPVGQREKGVYLGSLLEFLNYPAQAVQLARRNQHKEDTLDGYLTNLMSVVDSVTAELAENEALPEACFLHVSERYALLREKETLRNVKKTLDAAWKKCDYAGFLELYEKHQPLLGEDRLLKARAAYAGNASRAQLR